MQEKEIDSYITPQETEQTSQSLFTYHGYSHDSINVQSITHIAPALEYHLSQARTRTNITLEERTKPSNATIIKDLMSRFGYAGFAVYISSQMHGLHMLGPKDIQKRVEEIEEIDPSENLQEILNRRLLHEKFLKEYFILRFVDARKQDYDLEVTPDQQPNKLVIELDQLAKIYQNQVNSALERWDIGDFTGAIERYQKFRETLRYLGRKKEDYLSSFYSRRAKQTPNTGVSDFFLGGVNHAEAVTKSVGGKLENKRKNIVLTANLAAPENLPDYEINEILKSKGNVPDQLIAQALLFTLLLSNISTYAKEQGRTAEFAYTYEDKLSYICKIVENTTIEEIEAICRGELDLEDFMQQH